jgi:hypothetical protein
VVAEQRMRLMFRDARTMKLTKQLWMLQVSRPHGFSADGYG